MTNDPASLIETMIHDEDGRVDGEAPLDYVSDSWTRYAAHEILFPFAQRSVERGKIKDRKETIFSLAQSYEVPDYVIEATLNPNYHATCALAWDQIDG